MRSPEGAGVDMAVKSNASGAGAGRPARRGLDPAHQRQDDDDQQDQAEAAARVVAPASAVRPGGRRAYGQDQQDDDQQKDHDALLSLPVRSPSRIERASR